MIKVRMLDPFKLELEDVFLIDEGCKGSWDKANAYHQINAARNKNAWIFKFTGDAEGIFVFARGNTEKELTMTALAGKGFFKHFDEIYSAAKTLAKRAGARRMTGYVSRPGLKRLYERRSGGTPVATLFLEEFK